MTNQELAKILKIENYRMLAADITDRLKDNNTEYIHYSQEDFEKRRDAVGHLFQSNFLSFVISSYSLDTGERDEWFDIIFENCDDEMELKVRECVDLYTSSFKYNISDEEVIALINKGE